MEGWGSVPKGGVRISVLKSSSSYCLAATFRLPHELFITNEIFTKCGRSTKAGRNHLDRDHSVLKPEDSSDMRFLIWTSLIIMKTKNRIDS